MFDDVRNLYSAEIRAHGRTPRHARRLEAFDGAARGDNPMCGDRVQVWVRREDGRVAELGFEARGCEVTTASADLMCEAVAGRAADEVAGLAASVAVMARTGRCEACDPAFDRLRPLSAVHEYPSRVRCVTLPWDTLLAALRGDQDVTAGGDR